MKLFLKIVGSLLLLFGLIWIASIMGGVFSHAEGFTSLNDLWGGLAFHTICMVGGMACLVRPEPAKAAPRPAWGAGG